MKMNELMLKFSSIPDNVSVARMLIASLGSQLNLSINDIEEIKVAVSEAVSNAIIHGYRNKADRFVQLNINIDEESFAIRIQDKGCGIPDVEKAMQPAYSTDPERMGLGFVFMQSFMDELNVESVVDQGTTVSMVKFLKRVPTSSH